MLERATVLMLGMVNVFIGIYLFGTLYKGESSSSSTVNVVWLLKCSIHQGTFGHGHCFLLHLPMARCTRVSIRQLFIRDC
jgi:hypothetical protein